MAQQTSDARIPVGEFPAKCVGVTGRRPRFLHLLFYLLVHRNKADEIDEGSGAHRIRQEVLALAEPHLPALGWPFRNELSLHDATVGDRTGENGTRRRKHILPQLGVNSVGADDGIAFDDHPVGE